MDAPSTDILIVDDSEKNLLSLAALLEPLDARIVKAASGEDALRKLLEHDFAVILLDVQMPGLDGYETARLIRMRKRSAATPIIFVTAHHRTDENALRGYAVGAVDYLFKPIVPEVLLAKVGVFLELRRHEQALRRHEKLLLAAERREDARRLEEERNRYERALVIQQAERERRAAEELEQKNRELSLVIEAKELAESALQRNNDRLRRLAAATHLLFQEDAPEKLPDLLHEALWSSLDLDVFIHYAIEEGELVLRTAGGFGPSDHPGCEQLALSEAGPLLGAASSGTRAQLVADRPGGALQGTPLEGLGLTTVLCLPLRPEDSTECVLLGAREPLLLPDEALEVLQLSCNALAVLLERTRLVKNLRESDRRKDEYIALLGHELRNPLAPVRGSLELLRGEVQSDRAKRAVGAAERQLKHITRLVDDLLDVSRLSRGKVALQRRRLELVPIVEQALAAVEALVQERDHRLQVTFDDPDAELVADPDRLVQILVNLLTNAARYTDPGGEIRLTASVVHEQIDVRIRDNGIGMDAAALEQIFDPFVQARGIKHPSNGGLGIGLTLVKHLVELHGGHVLARSEGPGRGTEIELVLPMGTLEASEPLPPPVEALRRTADASEGLDVLLVEDNEDIRMVMKDLLEMLGHRVIEAADGNVGAELLLAHKPQVALVDLGLPGIDGYELVARVRAQQNGSLATRLVALTGYGSDEDRRKALAAGFHAHLAKPISTEQLQNVLRVLD